MLKNRIKIERGWLAVKELEKDETRVFSPKHIKNSNNENELKTLINYHRAYLKLEDKYYEMIKQISNRKIKQKILSKRYVIFNNCNIKLFLINHPLFYKNSRSKSYVSHLYTTQEVKIDKIYKGVEVEYIIKKIRLNGNKVWLSFKETSLTKYLTEKNFLKLVKNNKIK